ncbi:prepilin peptidase CpaA [Paenibacillus sp. DS2015]|uniref:A24 family peptidase n=1 Tax=Paenibacillus sp. DS2015 TaxID=3373917 RepID=UPI003D1F9DB3
MELAYGGCALFLILAFITDVRTMKIPNKLTIPAMISGILYQIVNAGWEGLLFSGKGFLAGFGILLFMYWMGAVGAGDVKLFGGIGIWTGALFTVQVMLYSILYASLIGVVILLWRREALSRIRNIARGIAGFLILKDISLLKGNGKEQLRFPFMLAVIPGAISAYLYIVS